jgi:hypothetical protein
MRSARAGGEGPGRRTLSRSTFVVHSAAQLGERVDAGRRMLHGHPMVGHTPRTIKYNLT